MIWFMVVAMAQEPSVSGGEVNLESWVAAFFESDRLFQVSQVEAAAASLAVDRSRDRLNVHVVSSPSVSVADTRLSTGADVDGSLGWGANASVLVDDGIGGSSTLTVGADSGVDATGNNTVTTSTSLRYSLPLVRNALGKLYQLETTQLSLTAEARRIDQTASQIDRCTAALGLYTDAWRLDAYGEVWDDLLERKEKAFERTKVDYARRMVPRLDLLTAESDWVDTQSRRRSWQQQRASALAGLGTWLPELPQGDFAEPDAIVGALPAEGAEGEIFAEHPLVRSQTLTAEATRAQADLTRQSFVPEVALVPNAGVNRTTGGQLPTGGELDTTALYAGLALDIQAPVRPRTRRYDLETLAYRAQQAEMRAWEQERSLTERLARTRETLAEIEDRLVFNARKVELAEAQLAEAGRRYADGRLEYQDYVQHWVTYENVRFETLDLSHARYSQLIELVRILGVVPDVCEVS